MDLDELYIQAINGEFTKHKHFLFFAMLIGCFDVVAEVDDSQKHTRKVLAEVFARITSLDIIPTYRATLKKEYMNPCELLVKPKPNHLPTCCNK